MKPFAVPRTMRRFQKAQLPFAETLEDFAVLTEIGFHPRVESCGPALRRGHPQALAPESE